MSEKKPRSWRLFGKAEDEEPDLSETRPTEMVPNTADPMPDANVTGDDGLRAAERRLLRETEPELDIPAEPVIGDFGEPIASGSGTPAKKADIETEPAEDAVYTDEDDVTADLPEETDDRATAIVVSNAPADEVTADSEYDADQLAAIVGEPESDISEVSLAGEAADSAIPAAEEVKVADATDTAQIATVPADDLESTRLIDTAAAPTTAVSEPESALTDTPWATLADDDTSASADDLFEGATVIPKMPSRAGAHIWSFLLTLVLAVPVWFLATYTSLELGDAVPGYSVTGVRVGLIVLMALAAVAVFVYVLIARLSSLGTYVTAIVTLVIGGFAVFAPTLALPYVEKVADALTGTGISVMVTAAKLINATVPNGVLLIVGAAMLALAFVSSGARKKGRKRAELKEQIAQARAAEGE
ncbi:MAG: hypothetical protein SOS98_01745 [Varibaculum sp.]|nr:hypothetical protein [Varibaculum sp.]